jgi:hypothetical protein
MSFESVNKFAILSTLNDTFDTCKLSDEPKDNKKVKIKKEKKKKTHQKNRRPNRNNNSHFHDKKTSDETAMDPNNFPKLGNVESCETNQNFVGKSYSEILKKAIVKNRYVPDQIDKKETSYDESDFTPIVIPSMKSNFKSKLKDESFADMELEDCPIENDDDYLKWITNSN